LDWTDKLLQQSRATLDGWYRALLKLKDVEPAPGVTPDELLRALNDDLNTPLAFAAVSAYAADANKADNAQSRALIKAKLLEAGALLGVLQHDPESWFQADAGEGPTAEEIEGLLARRQEARAAKDFAESDRIRDDLAARGVLIEDGAGGATWRRAG